MNNLSSDRMLLEHCLLVLMTCSSIILSQAIRLFILFLKTHGGHIRWTFFFYTDLGNRSKKISAGSVIMLTCFLGSLKRSPNHGAVPLKIKFQ